MLQVTVTFDLLTAKSIEIIHWVMAIHETKQSSACRSIVRPKDEPFDKLVVKT